MTEAWPGEPWTIAVPPKPIWRVTLRGMTGVELRHHDAPNWFYRRMLGLALGVGWERIK